MLEICIGVLLVFAALYRLFLTADKVEDVEARLKRLEEQGDEKNRE